MSRNKVVIPVAGRKALLSLLQIGNEKREKLHQLLSTIEPAMFAEKIVDQIISKIDLGKKHLEDIISTIFDLYFNAWKSGKEISNFITLAINSINDECSSPDDKIVTSEQQKILIDYLQKVVALDQTVGISAKGIALSIGNAKLFSTANVYTDIRPCFPVGFEKEFLGGIILHQLEINYYEEGGSKQVYLTLDTCDVAALKEQLNRAEEKEKYLRSKKNLNNFCFIDNDIPKD